MTTTESDLELLEQYLDGALEGLPAISLRDRLEIDLPLTEAMKELQAQRAVRKAVWHSMEPTAAAQQQLVWRVRGAMLSSPKQRSGFFASPWRVASVGSTAAACMVLGFFFGRLGHANIISPAVSPAVPAPIIATGNSGTTVMDKTVTDVKPSPNNAFAQATASAAPAGTSPRISVPITNEYGQVVAWQTFDSPAQAKSFTEDLHHAHGDGTSPATSGQIKTVGEQVPF